MSNALPDFVRAAVVTLSLVIGTVPARAADEGKTATLVKAIVDGCRVGPDGVGTVTSADLRTGLSKAFPIDAWSAPDREQLFREIREAGVNPGPLTKDLNADSVSRIGLIIHGWLTDDPQWLSMASGGVKIVAANNQALTDNDFIDVLRAIFIGDSANRRGFKFVCKTSVRVDRQAVNLKEDNSGAPATALTIAKDAGQLGKLKADDQKAGEISFSDDHVKHNLTFATTIAAGLRIPLGGDVTAKSSKPGASVTSASIIPFILYDRQGGNDPTDKSYVNNLSLGVQTNGYLQFDDRNGHNTFQAYYAVISRYETDDGLHSSAWFGEVQLEPLFSIPGDATPYFIAGDTLTGFGFSWSTTGVLDHSSVTNPWKKQALLDTNHFTRLGGDINGVLILRRWKGEYDTSGDYAWSVELSSTLSERWKLGPGKGTAHLWSSKLSFSPAKNYSFSLGYDRGRDLDSLAKKKLWKVTLDLKK